MIEDDNADPMKWKNDSAPEDGWILKGGMTISGHDVATRKFRRVHLAPGEPYRWRKWCQIPEIVHCQYELPDGSIIENTEFVGGTL